MEVQKKTKLPFYKRRFKYYLQGILSRSEHFLIEHKDQEKYILIIHPLYNTLCNYLSSISTSNYWLFFGWGNECFFIQFTGITPCFDYSNILHRSGMYLPIIISKENRLWESIIILDSFFFHWCRAPHNYWFYFRITKITLLMDNNPIFHYCSLFFYNLTIFKRTLCGY